MQPDWPELALHCMQYPPSPGLYHMQYLLWEPHPAQWPHIPRSFSWPGTSQHMTLTGTACNVGPRMAGAGAVYGTIQELLG